MYQSDIERMEGLTIERIEGLKEGSERATFYFTDGSTFSMEHMQDCCESVYIEQVDGDPEDLRLATVTTAYESNVDEAPLSKWDHSYTWTFYRINTPSGSLVIRWYGTSNGWYGEEPYTYWVEGGAT